MTESGFGADALDAHDFLGGRLRVLQPRRGFRSGSDAVLLAAAVPAQAGESVLELGIGAGVATLCLAIRVPGLRHSALEVQPEYAALAARNAERAGVALDLHIGDVAAPPAELRALRFDHVFANPPYYAPEASAPLPDTGKDRAFRAGSLAAWIDCGLRRLKDGGCLTVIQRSERLPELLLALEGRAGDIRIKPLAARADAPAQRILLRARKTARAPLRLCPPLVLHDSTGAHSEAAEAILRSGCALDF